MIEQGRNISRKWFETAHLMADLKTRSVKGGANTVFAQLLSFGMSMLSTAIMARLVAPESFGVVAMVTAVAGFVTIFKDMGFSSAVVQNKVISQKQISTLFWINTTIGLLISFVICVLAPILVWFYKENRLLHITWAYAVSIFVSSLALQHHALLKRQMRFKRVSSIRILATSISIIIGVALAMLDFDYWAVVAIPISYTVVSSVLTWLYCDWRPSFAFDFSRVVSFMRFGSGITGFELVNYLSRNLDNILIGRQIGAIALGLYSKSYQLLMLPITQLRVPLNTVALPALSALQSQPRRYKEFYNRYVFILAFFSMPMVVFLFVFAKEVVLVVLGDQWIEAAHIFQLLALAAFIQPVAGTRGVVMITMGQTRKYFLWGVVNAIFTVLGFLFGIQWGVAGVAWSYIFVNYLLLLPSLRWSYKGTPVTIRSFLKEISFPLLFSILSGVTCFFFKNVVRDIWPVLSVLLVGVTLGIIIYALCWFSLRVTRKKLELVLEVKNLIQNRM